MGFLTIQGIQYCEDFTQGHSASGTFRLHEIMAFRDYSIGSEVSLYDGNWGTWSGFQDLGPNWYVCGASLRVEADQGSGDDTAANGLILWYCDADDWYNQQSAVIHSGYWGDWSDRAMCPEGQYVTGGNVRYEFPIDGDDTALNGLQIQCGGSTWHTVHNGYWGSWIGERTFSKPGWAVTSARVRVESEGGDDTAMNGIRFVFSPVAGDSRVIPSDWEGNHRRKM